MRIQSHPGTCALLAIVVAACGPTVHWRQQSTAAPLSAACCPMLIDLGGDPPAEGILLAEMGLGDTGFTISCSREQNLERVRQRACGVGADVVRLLRVRGVFSSTCDYVRAELYSLPERPQPARRDGPKIIDGTALCSDRFSLRPRATDGSAPLGDAAAPATGGM